MDVKQIIAIRTDLKMSTGKLLAQASHASGYWMLERMKRSFKQDKAVTLTDAEYTWLHNEKFTKIVLELESEEQLMEVARHCSDRDVPFHIVTDIGLTEFNGVLTKTCIGIGPDKNEDIDAITGRNGLCPLKLLRI
jgi:PTH2 family peptidyl-tRNA hydrolase